MKETADIVMVDEEVEALAVVRGKPRFVQEVADYHQVEEDGSPLLIVTRYAYQAGIRSSGLIIAALLQAYWLGY